MATFFLLPSRHFVGRQFQQFLESWFPGLSFAGSDLAELGESLADRARSRPDVFIVYREDLDEASALAETLPRDFGAEEGDEVVEVRPPDVVRWRVPAKGARAA